ncbi:hypothetical protein ZHAS_00001148 [Anopheles sinensis]|uniref:Uncharacterized protein n=1 Tax=Anopheles sinensis TaxID=74873 RepID=A0A084VB30_ANOSI|nr:hypothetical protein ZHAS_00001148 [Anopheles sinensis]
MTSLNEGSQKRWMCPDQSRETCYSQDKGPITVQAGGKKLRGFRTKPNCQGILNIKPFMWVSVVELCIVKQECYIQKRWKLQLAEPSQLE